MSKRQLDDWLDAYLEYTSESEPPTIFHKWVGISAIASALKRKCYLDWGSLTFYPNMYVVLVAPSGRARKGTAMNEGYRILEEIGIKMAAESITREALCQELAESKGEIIELSNMDLEDRKPIYHCSLTIFSPELTVFLGHNNFTLMMDLTDWYDCRNRWIYRTKGKGTDEIIGVWVNLIGATTPSLIQAALPMDAIGGGLTSRMIFVFAQNKKKIVPCPSYGENAMRIRSGLVQDMEKIHLMQGRFTFNKQFVIEWTDWYHAQEGRPPFNDERFGGYIERRPNHVMKLSMIMCAARTQSMKMEECDLRKAIATLEEAEVKMPMAFSGVGKLEYSDTVASIVQYIYERKLVSVQELMERYSHDLDYKLLQSIIEGIVVRGIARMEYKGSNNDKYLRYTPKENKDESPS